MPDITCPHCEYEWEYSGDLGMATCPNCQRKVSVDGD